MADDQADTIAFLSTPDAYGLRGQVERQETHGSIVFLAGDRAYKLKRSVRYPYMDYSTVERRKAMCASEVAVNRRLAPQLYLGVCPVVEDSMGNLRLGRIDGQNIDDQNCAIDWLVVMRRFEQGLLLEELRGRGELTRPLMRILAERIAEVHASAEIYRNFGGAGAIASVIDENVGLLRQMAKRPFDRNKIDWLESLSRQVLERVGTLLGERQKDGHVRRCHGDLHLNNICLLDGKPVLFDAIEFRDDFACIDVLYDLAFVLMDLERHGLRAHANALLNRYLECTVDYAGLAALPLFLSCRAAVRAHVTMSAVDLSGGGCSSPPSDTALRLLDLAISYLEPNQACLVAIGGVSGTGKSTLAVELAPQIWRSPGAIVLRSDVVRKELCGVDELSRLPAEAYAANVTRHVYSTVAARAHLILKGGYSVVADAVFGKPEQRRRIEAVAQENSVPFKGLWLEAAVDVLEGRLRVRHSDASDATVDVLKAQLADVEAPGNWTRLEATGSLSELVARANRLIGS